jgi:cell division protein ZapA
MNKGTIKVNIFGQEYSIVGEDDTTDIKALAQFVDAEMKKISDSTPMPASRIAVLTCLNIMERFIEDKKKHQNEIKEVLTLCDSLLNKIERDIDKKH